MAKAKAVKPRMQRLPLDLKQDTKAVMRRKVQYAESGIGAWIVGGMIREACEAHDLKPTQVLDVAMAVDTAVRARDEKREV